MAQHLGSRWSPVVPRNGDNLFIEAPQSSSPPCATVTSSGLQC
ncbi:hypothetical protein BofuT4_uP011440.1 [Botrytis cinerea T4]|uniref:Uncharacterized protein n=1 Tax=Botryotinia fuckeliana (strain T4) TaxID=999810 RepID=G2XS31_BOTF4|nr:hypothetical protein BofuT4_uP011440.1 [Botrytis cinerea T4]